MIDRGNTGLSMIFLLKRRMVVWREKRCGGGIGGVFLLNPGEYSAVILLQQMTSDITDKELVCMLLRQTL